jgi:dienelactone hydrolase
VLGQANEGEFIRKLVSHSAADGESIQSFLFEPRTPPRAAVVALHQHNSDWSLGKSEIAGLAGDPLQAFGPALARAGVLVLAPDALGFESRRGSPDAGAHVPAPPLGERASARDWLQYYNHAMHRLVQGELLMTKLLGDVASAVSALEAVAPGTPIGVVGHSFGGNLALFAAALDTRVSSAVCSGAASSFRHKLAHGIGLEMALVIPGFALRFDTDDLMRCIAPRRLLVVSSDRDPFSADAVQLVTATRPAFAALGASENLGHLHTHGLHALDRERFDAIVHWLAGATR